MTRYDFLEARCLILSNVRTDSSLTSDFKAMFKPTSTCPNIMSLLVNFSCELEKIMSIYDFIWPRWFILSNVRIDSNLVNFSCELGSIMTRYDFIWVNKWFWTMFQPTPTWPNSDFGKLYMWIGSNNVQIWLPRGYMSDFVQCSNWLQLYLILLLVNFSYELWQIMTRYVCNEDDVWRMD